MGFDIPLVDGLGRGLSLDDDVGLREPGVDIAELHFGAAGHVAGERLHRTRLGIDFGQIVKHGCVGPHGFFGSKDSRQGLVGNIYESQRFLGDVRADGGYSGDGLTPVKDLVARHDVAELKEESRAAGPVESRGDGLEIRKVGRRHHRAHTVEVAGTLDVDRQDPGVGVDAAQYPAVEHPRWADVGAIARSPRDLVGAVVTQRSLADDSIFALGKDEVGLVV